MRLAEYPGMTEHPALADAWGRTGAGGMMMALTDLATACLWKLVYGLFHTAIDSWPRDEAC